MKYLSILSVLLLIGGNFSFAMEEEYTKDVNENVDYTQKPKKTRLQRKIELVRKIRKQDQIEEELKKEKSKEEELNITKKKRTNNLARERHQRVMKVLGEERQKLKDRINDMCKQGKVSKKLKKIYDDEIERSFSNRKIFGEITKEINELDEKQDKEMIKDLESKYEMYKRMYPSIYGNEEEEDVFVIKDFSTKQKEDQKINSEEKNDKEKKDNPVLINKKTKLKMKGPRKLKTNKDKQFNSNSSGNSTGSASTAKLPIVNNTDELKNRNPYDNIMVLNNNDDMEDIKYEDLGKKYYDNEGSHELSEFKHIDEK